ncbi:UvrD-helicase domain-containing protein [Microbacterium sp. P07]|uniref:UvrD-helicase domain-containing protein n=1 Tax=Microbacterium sp. P07 TaxID=3366952 RepID=UPI003745F44D
MTISAETIARALGLPPPTDDQRAVIEAPPRPALVVAGAGSGKTETMAGRVVWLVANGHVAPDEVLGLTFTRKAAGELAERIGRRLATVREYSRRDLLPHLDALVDGGPIPAFWEAHADAPPRVRDAAFGALLDRLADQIVPDRAPRAVDGEDLVFRPRVATYNAFADALVREHGARIGRDPDSALLSQSGSWLLARRVVIGSDDERLAEREEAFSTVVDAVHRLSGDVLDNRVDLDGLIDFARSWDARLSSVTCRLKGDQDKVDKARRSMTGLPVLAELVREYARRKRVDDTLDFADQVADALTIIEQAPEVGDALRAQYRVVLLDEYQDTSVLQTRLLAAIFRDTAVMAVGDPHQSIYGWRGASADNLTAFPRAFSSTGECDHFQLMISWRNDVAILTAANALLDAARGADVETLSPRPGAASGRVTRIFAPSAEDEAREVAAWFVEVRAAHAASGASRAHSGAVLFRTKRHMQLFADALDAAGVPNRILGLGGLLSTPEVVDVVAALRVVHDPAQGSSLIRLLAGPRFAVGVADLAGLHALADTLSRRDAALDPLAPELAARVRASAGADEQLSIIDALEFIRRTTDDHGFLRGISVEGRTRLRDAAEMFDRLRRAVGQPIPDLIRLIELELRLDIELAANEARGPARVSTARLRTFLDEVRAFLLADDRGSVGSLLAWLAHAEETDELMPRPEPPEPGVVQLLTIHGSKGLEWDAVAVVRLVDKELPKAPRTVNGWLGFGVLPYPLRGDRDALPRLDWALDGDDADLPDAIEEFRATDRAHQEREERRLAYVAVTRAKSELLLTGSHWAGQKEPRVPSRYLVEMLEALGAPPIEEPAPEENPYLDKGGRIVTWPLDPLGGRRDVVMSAVDEVTRAADLDPVPDETLVRLLAELERRRRGVPVRPPARIPASRFKDYVTDYRGTVSAVTRPLPERPFRQTRLGTLFHSWVEQRSGRAGSAGSVDDALWEVDDDDASEASVSDAVDLARLKAVFEQSEWATLAPLEVESEIDFTLSTDDGEQHVMICKLDAVFRRDDRGGRIEIVDWKTGRAPTTAAERDERMLQLALYRLAYHKKHGIPLAEIDVTLYYVADDLVIRSDRVWTENELATRWQRARDAARPRAQTP